MQRDDAAGADRRGQHRGPRTRRRSGARPRSRTTSRCGSTPATCSAAASSSTSIGNYAAKKVTGGFYYRNPNTRGGVFSNDGGETLLIGDVRDARDGVLDGSSNCPTVTVTNDRPDPVALARVFADPNCFSYQEMFPGGFTPQFGGDVQRLLGGGRHPRPDREAPVLGRERGLRLERGAVLHQQHRERLAGSRLTHLVRPRPVQAGGGEPQPEARLPDQQHGPPGGRPGVARREVHDRRRDRPSPGSTAPSPTQGFSAASNGFPGFSPISGGNWSRSNFAGYVDAEAGRGSNWTRGRGRPLRALRRLRLHAERQARRPLRVQPQRGPARQREHRLPGADARASRTPTTSRRSSTWR